jgi:hypothetical protein
MFQRSSACKARVAGWLSLSGVISFDEIQFAAPVSRQRSLSGESRIEEIFGLEEFDGNYIRSPSTP